MAETLRQYCDRRLAGLMTDQSGWLPYLRELADYILPRRYRWLLGPNEAKGPMINGKIIDSTGTVAARTLAAGMMSGVTSPTRPWFKLKIQGFPNDESHPVSVWLAECEKVLTRIFQESNFYNGMATIFHDIAVFATAPMIIDEDYDNVIRCFNPCAGEYYLANSERLMADTLYRRFNFSIKQMAQRWSKEKLSPATRALLDSGGIALTQQRPIAHAIEPNTDNIPGAPPKRFKYRAVYWEYGTSQEQPPLEVRGYHECPFIAPRWDIVGNDAYGSGPSMDALADIKQLQQETKRKAQAIDKMVAPPMLADIELKNQPASQLPGGITYIARKDSIGMKPIYQVVPPIQELKEDIHEVQERIKVIFFNDLFLMISQLQTVRTATEIDARREEKLVMLGPVLERFENEALDPAIDRVFNIASRAGLLPPPPEEIRGMPIDVQYVSMLAEAQRAVAATGIERYASFVGNLMAANPTIGDGTDWDEMAAEYGSLMAVSPKIIRDKDEVAEIRQQRDQKQQQLEQLQITDAAVKGAKTLSETDVGGGQNALAQMMGNAA